jgi:hypothetical protein
MNNQKYVAHSQWVYLTDSVKLEELSVVNIYNNEKRLHVFIKPEEKTPELKKILSQSQSGPTGTSILDERILPIPEAKALIKYFFEYHDHQVVHVENYVVKQRLLKFLPLTTDVYVWNSFVFESSVRCNFHFIYPSFLYSCSLEHSFALQRWILLNKMRTPPSSEKFRIGDFSSPGCSGIKRIIRLT